MRRSQLSRLVGGLFRCRGDATEAAAARGSQAGARQSSTGAGGASASSGSTAAAAPAAGATQQPQQPPLAAMARLQQTSQQQQYQQQQAGRRILLAEPVSMNRGTLWAGGFALLAGGVVLGTQADRLAKQSDQLGKLVPAVTADHGTAADVLLTSQRWVADHLPSFMSHSQARSNNASSSSSSIGGSSSKSAAADRHSTAGDMPLGGVLSPYFISDAAAKAAPAVVNIMVQGTSALPVGSSGSGFIVDPDGTILTNAHVVSDAIQRHYFGGGSSASSASSSGSAGGGPPGSGSKGITITLQDGRIFEGRLVSYDTVSDLAVLKVESDAPLPTAKLGRSASLRVGEWVVALGSPLHLQNSVTAGIVSCVDRKAVELGLAGARTDYIQTDAAINKGNSGGPLVNLYGEVIGISAMKAVAADGVSFAIPVDSAVEVMMQLQAHGRVIRPYVGIKMLQLNKHNAAQFRKRDANFPDVQDGILVPGVHPGSPAERAGLRAGDCIIGFGDRTHDVTTTSLIKALGEHIGKPLQLRVARPGDVVETLTVVALEASDGHH